MSSDRTRGVPDEVRQNRSCQRRGPNMSSSSRPDLFMRRTARMPMTTTLTQVRAITIMNSSGMPPTLPARRTGRHLFPT